MRPMAVLVSLVTLIAAVTAVVWIGQPPAPVKNEVKPQAVADPGMPAPRAQGPHPKVVVPESEYNFGVAMQMDKGSHVFKIKNEGTVPLKLKVGKTTCQCTIGSLGDDAVPPGGETTIELNWQIKAPAPNFHHSATIHSDDPEKLAFQLEVTGLVGRQFMVLPESVNFSAMTEGVDSKGVVFVASSSSDSFKLTKTESSSDAVRVEVSEADENERAAAAGKLMEVVPEFRGDQTKLSSLLKKVYVLRIFAQPKSQRGTFSEIVRVASDIPDTEPIEVRVTGDAPSVFQFFPAPNARFYTKSMTCDLGDIDASMGKKTSLKVTARGQVDPLELKIVKIEPSNLEATFIPDPNTKHIGRIEVRLPPGSSGLFKSPDDPAKIEMESNHPLTKSVTLNVIFNVK